jgi:hypothetical protein
VKVALLLLLVCSSSFAETFTYWIEPCKRPEAECEADDVRLAEWAMEAWQRAAQGGIKFEKSSLSKARIRLYWASTGNAGLYGEARAIEVDGKPGAEVAIRPSLHALGHKVEGVGSRDRMFRHVIVYLTCLHEVGHALGMDHTRNFADIMYSFEYGGNILEYFGRYRRKLKSLEDIKQVSGLSPEDERKLLLIYRNGNKDANAADR